MDFEMKMRYVVRSWVWKMGVGEREGLEVSGCYNCLVKV